jgi:catechol 2,3-dioxygenase-like lactoylglutathione lyase family enzyme
MIEGLSHITFVVRDLDRMTQFLEVIFEAEEAYYSGDKTFSLSKEKFFLINGIWVAIMQGEPVSQRTYNHVAFKIADSDLEKYRERIKSLSVEFREGRNRVEGEGSSLYFYDYDNHLFELHTGTLEQRLARYHETTPA